MALRQFYSRCVGRKLIHYTICLTGQLHYALKAMIREVWGPQAAPRRVFAPGLVTRMSSRGKSPYAEPEAGVRQVNCVSCRSNRICGGMEVGKNMIFQGISIKLVYLEGIGRVGLGILKPG